MHSQATPNSEDNSQLSMVPTTVSARSAAAPQPQTGPEPTYPFAPLLALTGLTPEEFAAKVGISRASAYRRAKNGVKWSEADDWAIAFNRFPWQVWPEWALADPADWCDIPPDPDEGDGESPDAAAGAAA
jgi:hypothetical protein